MGTKSPSVRKSAGPIYPSLISQRGGGLMKSAFFVFLLMFTIYPFLTDAESLPGPVNNPTSSHVNTDGHLASLSSLTTFNSHLDLRLGLSHLQTDVNSSNGLYGNYLSSSSKWQFKVENLFDTPRELTLNYPEPQRRFFASLRRKI